MYNPKSLVSELGIPNFKLNVGCLFWLTCESIRILRSLEDDSMKISAYIDDNNNYILKCFDPIYINEILFQIE